MSAPCTPETPRTIDTTRIAYTAGLGTRRARVTIEVETADPNEAERLSPVVRALGDDTFDALTTHLEENHS